MLSPPPLQAGNSREIKSEQLYRQIPEEQRRMLFPAIMWRIVKIADSHPEQIWIFERHLCSMNEDASLVERGIPEEHGPRMVGQGIILAHPQQIALRRKMDQIVRHDRHSLSANQIAVEQVTEVSIALEASRRWNFPVRLFFNDTGQSLRVASEMVDFLREVIK